MTIKRSWTLHLPIIGGIRITKRLKPGYTEIVNHRTIDDEGRYYINDNGLVSVVDDETLRFDRLIPGTLEELIQSGQEEISYPPNYPTIYENDKGIQSTYVHTGEKINTDFPDVYAGFRDELYMRTPGNIANGPQLTFHWEPTLPPQSRK